MGFNVHNYLSSDRTLHEKRDQIELPLKMDKEYVKKLRRKYPQSSTINDSATYEYEVVDGVEEVK